jgi:hypothetical protein
MIQLAHAVNRATAIEKTHNQTVESTVEPLPEMPSSTVTSPRPLHSPRIKPKTSPSDTISATDIAKQIEAQAARVEQLSAELRAAMAQLKTMTQSGTGTLSTRSDTSSSTAAAVTADGLLEPSPQAAIAPTSDTTVANTSEASLSQAKQNATSTAQLLRRLKHRQRPSDRLRPRRLEPTSTGTKPSQGKGLRSAKQNRWLRRSHRWLKAAIQVPVGLPALLSDAAVWLAIAAALRVGLQALIQTYPVLWFPVVLLLAGLAMLTTYQIAFNSAFNSALSSTWGYRLLLIVMGLLLGGHL